MDTQKLFFFGGTKIGTEGLWLLAIWGTILTFWVEISTWPARAFILDKYADILHFLKSITISSLNLQPNPTFMSYFRITPSKSSNSKHLLFK